MVPDPSGLPSAARDLFALRPEAFVGARDALVTQLKDAGDMDSATVVRALRRPTMGAWAIDQAARSEPRLVEELIASGDRLAEAQRRVLSGEGDADGLRRAGEERRELIRRLTEAATQALTDAGRSGAGSGDEIAGTFEAVTLDPDVAARVRDGVLERTVAPPPGLGAVEGLQVLDGGGGRAPARTAASDRRDAERTIRAAEEAETAATHAQERARSARVAAEDAARQADELDVSARVAERDARRLANEAGTARARAQRAVRRLERS